MLLLLLLPLALLLLPLALLLLLPPLCRQARQQALCSRRLPAAARRPPAATQQTFCSRRRLPPPARRHLSLQPPLQNGGAAGCQSAAGCQPCQAEKRLLRAEGAKPKPRTRFDVSKEYTVRRRLTPTAVAAGVPCSRRLASQQQWLQQG